MLMMEQCPLDCVFWNFGQPCLRLQPWWGFWESRWRRYRECTSTSTFPSQHSCFLFAKLGTER